MSPDSSDAEAHGEQDSPLGSLDPERWLAQHGDFLYSMAYLRLRDSGKAEDCVQETLLAAWKARDSFQGRSSERTWLVAILKRKIVDQLRRMFRENAPEHPAVEEEIEGVGHYPSGKWQGHWIPEEGPVDWGDNPHAVFERKEFWETLERCLSRLSPRLAAVFVLYEMDELPAESICRELEISPTNLWVMLHRARKQLRLCLERDWFGRGPK